MISKGLQWRVGNGSEIQIYQDNWLPDPHLNRVLSSPEFLGMEAKVAVLIDGVNRSWLCEVIDNIFLPHEAKMIKSIPISLVECDDKIFWPLTANEEYSVKTGYRLLSQLAASDIPSPSDISQSKQIWNAIWNLNVPNRIKIFLWRAGLNALPSRMNLVKRKVLCDPICPSCGVEKETILHALWSCPALAEVWSIHFAWLSRQTRCCSNFLDLLQSCCAKRDCFELFAVISSIIWTRRNRMRAGELTVPLKRINALARDTLQEFLVANPPSCGIAPAPTLVKWLPPPVGWVKVNFDGALFKECDSAGLGVIIRNDLGLVMAASTHIIPLPTSVEMVEVLAARHAICLARELQFNKVIVEGDSEVVI